MPNTEPPPPAANRHSPNRVPLEFTSSEAAEITGLTELGLSPGARLADPPSTGGAAITAHGLTKAYKTVTALKDVSIEIAPGEFYGLIGPNGAGKTTLMEILQGLLSPDAGTVRVLGGKPADRSPALLRRIGIQPQSTAFFTRATAREHLETLADIYRVDRRRVGATLETFGLSEAARTRVDRLSGGERQKLAVASAMLHDPEVLFLDEPTAAMDTESRAELVARLHQLRGSGITVLYTTHLLHEAERLCDRIAILDRGRVIANDTPAQLLADSDLPTRLILPLAVGRFDEIASLHEVLEIDLRDGRVELTVRAAGSALAALVELGFDVSDVRIEAATLEDVFLRLSGKESHHE
ncbi:MAG: ABC transporter ATP-binding protein [Bifidobacteriaceae bacterium]|jgi:ABC-2 type transport system ATP-binding protein|nr:ABC transporter ATP-binding protein [Bifidobacteriaceae bacterium]